ncbi:30S ribosomal protein S5 [Patescibacteria group bacterium]|nr:30S ribosomal protein S5 [Patescibacteria group bacterium]
MAKFGRKFKRREKPEFEQELVDIARVARIVAGGRRMRFRATIVIGDKKKRVGMGVAKGNDVSTAIEKAVAQAKKNMVSVSITPDGTIPHEVTIKKGASRLFLKPAFKGTGIIAGGSVRQVMEMAGVKNVFGKIYGTNNKLNNVQAAIEALKSLQTKEEIFAKRGKKLEVKDVVKKVLAKPIKKVVKKESKPKK